MGALSLLEANLCVELLCNYAEFVHGYLPSLGLHDLLWIIGSGDGPNGPLSLMFFQAVMFAGTAFVGLPSINIFKFNYLL